MTVDRRPDFYDRDGAHLRCRECLLVFERNPEYLDGHVREHLPCPGCALDSLIPAREESEWPSRKHPDDPMRGVSTVER